MGKLFQRALEMRIKNSPGQDWAVTGPDSFLKILKHCRTDSTEVRVSLGRAVYLVIAPYPDDEHGLEYKVFTVGRRGGRYLLRFKRYDERWAKKFGKKFKIIPCRQGWRWEGDSSPDGLLGFNSYEILRDENGDICGLGDQHVITENSCMALRTSYWFDKEDEAAAVDAHVKEEGGEPPRSREEWDRLWEAWRNRHNSAQEDTLSLTTHQEECS